MAVANQKPGLVNPIIARAALLGDLPRVLKARGAASLQAAGWTVLHDHGLLIPMKGQKVGDTAAEDYYLRLEFFHYPVWPPSAQFVNPATAKFVRPDDLYWLPKIEGSTEIQVHEHVETAGGQLICCSATLEFYLMCHSVKPEHVWEHPRCNFALTINQIEWALMSAFYKGRFRAQAV